MRHSYAANEDDGPGDTGAAAVELDTDFTSQTTFCICGGRGVADVTDPFHKLGLSVLEHFTILTVYVAAMAHIPNSSHHHATRWIWVGRQGVNAIRASKNFESWSQIG
jgi:hypothetical protein